MGLATSTGVRSYSPPGCRQDAGRREGYRERGQGEFHLHQGTRAAEQVRGRERTRGANDRRLAKKASGRRASSSSSTSSTSLAPRRGERTAATRRANGEPASRRWTDSRRGRRRSWWRATNHRRGDRSRRCSARVGSTSSSTSPPPPDGRAAILKTLSRGKTPRRGSDVARVGESGRCGGFSAGFGRPEREAQVWRRSLGTRAAATAHDEARERRETAAGGGRRGRRRRRRRFWRRRRRQPAAHFEEAFKRVQPPASAADQRRYDELRRKLRRERGASGAEGAKTDGGQRRGRATGAGIGSKPRLPPRRIRRKAGRSRWGEGIRSRRPKRERCRGETRPIEKTPARRRAAERRVAKPSTPGCDLHITPTNLARVLPLATKYYGRYGTYRGQRVAHLLLRERTGFGPRLL